MNRKRRQNVSYSGKGSFEANQEALLTGKKREPDHAAIKRHQEYQNELRHGQRLIPFLLGRAALIISGIVSAFTGFYLLLMSATIFHVVGGIGLFLFGGYLGLRGLFGKKATLDDVWWFIPWW